MACEGAQAARDGLIADMVKLRGKLPVDVLIADANRRGITEPIDVAAFGLGYVTTALDKVVAAVIALAGPCCEDCEEDHNGLLADRDGASDAR